MPEFDEKVLDAFLEQQEKLYPKRVAKTREEALDFLTDSMAMVFDDAKQLWDYFDEEGIDPEVDSIENIDEALEVFAVGDGRYLLAEG